MKRFFSLLWLAFFSWFSIAFGAECPANKAIYTSSDGLKTFKTTDFAIKQSLGCSYTLFDDEDNAATFGFRLPPEGFYDTVKPDYYDLDRKDEQGSLICSQNKYIMLRGKVNDEVVYLWDETIKAAPCCVNFSLSEKGFNERLEDIGFSSDVVWLQDELVPMAKTEIDTITNNDYYSDFEQPLGEDIYALTGCRENETLYGDKYLKVAKIKSSTFNNSNLITCYANDFGHENWVKEAIKSNCSMDKDLMILISSSGKSNNIINAAKYCKENNIPLITLSGFKENNPLSDYGNVNIYIKSENYNFIEMSHHIILVAIVDIFAQNVSKDN